MVVMVVSKLFASCALIRAEHIISSDSLKLFIQFSVKLNSTEQSSSLESLRLQ